MKSNFDLDFDRSDRTGFPEIIYCEHKSAEQVEAIISAFMAKGHPVMGTRLSPEKAEILKGRFKDLYYDRIGEFFQLGKMPAVDKSGQALIITAGTSDEKVARECWGVLDFFGLRVDVVSDCGIAGVHRLMSHQDKIEKADVIIAIAGMEGALPGVVAGLTKSPVIAVPTSIGYGVNLNGLTTLFTMLATCAGGIGVVNIDNGYGAAILAAKILSLKNKECR